MNSSNKPGHNVSDRTNDEHKDGNPNPSNRVYGSIERGFSEAPLAPGCFYGVMRWLSRQPKNEVVGVSIPDCITLSSAHTLTEAPRVASEDKQPGDNNFGDTGYSVLLDSDEIHDDTLLTKAWNFFAGSGEEKLSEKQRQYTDLLFKVHRLLVKMPKGNHSCTKWPFGLDEHKLFEVIHAVNLAVRADNFPNNLLLDEQNLSTIEGVKVYNFLRNKLLLVAQHLQNELRKLGSNRGGHLSHHRILKMGT